MWEKMFGLGFVLLGFTILLFKCAAVVLRREGLSLLEQGRNKNLKESILEFSTSVVLSLSASAALGFLFVGLLGLLGVPIDVP